MYISFDMCLEVQLIGLQLVVVPWQLLVNKNVVLVSTNKPVTPPSNSVQLLNTHALLMLQAHNCYMFHIASEHGLYWT